jgi:hypothetical protein
VEHLVEAQDAVEQDEEVKAVEVDALAQSAQSQSMTRSPLMYVALRVSSLEDAVSHFQLP